MARRDRARESGDYELADQIRGHLHRIECGTVVKYRVVLQDTPAGITLWHWTARPR